MYYCRYFPLGIRLLFVSDLFALFARVIWLCMKDPKCCHVCLVPSVGSGGRASASNMERCTGCSRSQTSKSFDQEQNPCTYLRMYVPLYTHVCTYTYSRYVLHSLSVSYVRGHWGLSSNVTRLLQSIWHSDLLWYGLYQLSMLSKCSLERNVHSCACVCAQ